MVEIYDGECYFFACGLKLDKYSHVDNDDICMQMESLHRG